MKQYTNIELLDTPTGANHVITIGYGDAHYAALEHSHTLSEITDAAAELATLATKSELTAAVNGINLTLVSDYDTSDEIAALYATKSELTAYVKTTEMNSALTAYVTSQNLGTILQSYALTATLANYATAASVSQLQNYVDSTFASVTTVRGMIEGALTGYVSPSSLEAALANYALSVHTHTSAQISDATRIGGQNADAGKAVLLSDDGKIAGAMVPVDAVSIVITNGTISVSDSWLAGEVHGYTKTEVSAVSGTVLNLTKSGQVFDKSLSADATITLNTSGLVLDAGEAVEFDLFLTLGAGVTAHLPGWMTDNGPIYNYAQEGKTLFRVWSYDGGTTWNAKKESWLPPDYWKWVTTLSDAINHEGTSLRDAIGAANNGDVIKFLPELEGAITLEQGELVVSVKLTIDGGGKITVDANNVSRCLIITAADSEIKGMTFQHGNGTGGGTNYAGGAIFFDVDGVKLRDCIFRDNSVYALGNNYAYGGAVRGASGTVIERCVFEHNLISAESKSPYGEALYLGYGTVKDCLFENNSYSAAVALLYGVVYASSPVNDASLNILDCEFKNNTYRNSGMLRADFAGEIEIQRCKFTGNNGQSAVIEVAHSSRAPVFNVVDCSFTENIEENGIIRVTRATSTNVERCKFSNNESATSQNGVLFGQNDVHFPMTVSNCVFDGNISRAEGGVIVCLVPSTALIEDCVISGCEQSTRAIYVTGYDGQTGVTVSRCKLSGNSLKNTTSGLIYANTNAIVEINDCVVTGNTSTKNADTSVLVMAVNNSSITCRNCTFTDNGTLRAARANSGTINLYNCVDVGDGGAPTAASGQTLTVNHYLTDQTVTGESVIAYDESSPLFGEDNYTPVEGSQVIDAGDSSLVTAEADFNGDPRIVGNAVDLGAVEYQTALTLNVNRNLRNLNLNPVEPSEEDILRIQAEDEAAQEALERNSNINER